ncbi:MAG: TonB-dependent receptor [Mucinivorans sp.]
MRNFSSIRKARIMALAVLLGATLVGLPQSMAAPVENSWTAEQAVQKVTGKVIDEQGQPMVGVVVALKGTQKAVATDVNGVFELNAAQGQTLHFSYIGYKPMDRTVAGSTMEVTMDVDAQSLEEVVVVGYGKQKKVNLSGSVVSIDMAKINESRPLTNVSTALAGMATGVSVTSSSNAPGDNAASIRIRGQGTLNNSSPLVIIDGVEGSISSVLPQDVETMTVLKDAASSSIYGSRAANGVILITTKRGKAGTNGKSNVKFDYNGYVSFENASNMVVPVSNYADYMGLINEGFANSKIAKPYSQSTIDLWRANEGVDEYKYPNTDNFKAVFGNTGVSHQHNFAVSGGSDRINFYTSFGYMKNEGVVENTDYERFSLRANVEGKVTKWLTLGTNISGYMGKKNINAESLGDVFNYTTQSMPGMIYRSADGRYGAPHSSEEDVQSNNVLERLNARDGKNEYRNVKTRFYVTISPVKGLSFTGSYTYEYNDQDRWSKPVPIDKWNFMNETIAVNGNPKTSINTYNWKSNREFMDGVIRYENSWLDNRLDFGVMFGASQEQYESHNYSSSKTDLIDPSIDVIGGAIGDASAGGGKSDWAMRSYFGRVNFGWDNKYLLEFDFRSDASSRFVPSKRWGFFPSASVAWRLDQENFMKEATWLNSLKLRGSYGALGNNSVGNYDAISNYNTTNYILNNAVTLGMSQTALANSMLTWETTYVGNAAIDFSMFDSRFYGTLEYFNKTTKDILIDLPAPGVHGNADIPKQNSAEVLNTGIEVMLGWRDRVGDFSYGISGNFTWVTNKVTKFKGDERQYSGNSFIQEGFPINVQFLRPVDRILQTDEDMMIVKAMLDKEKAAAAAENRKERKVFEYGTPEKGDLLYIDANGDGIVNADDRQVYGKGPNPQFLMGANLEFAWKGIDLSILLQGAWGIQGYFTDFSYRPIARRGNMLNRDICDGRWYEGRTDARFPRLLEAGDTRNQNASDFWLSDKSYFKIRNIQLGYSFPKAWMNKMKFERIRVYVSLENYFTFTDYPGLDPEIGGVGYPTMKQATIGLNITF